MEKDLQGLKEGLKAKEYTLIQSEQLRKKYQIRKRPAMMAYKKSGLKMSPLSMID